MSFNIGIIISNDCNSKIIRKLRKVYNLPLKKVKKFAIQKQLGKGESFYIMMPYDADYCADYWSYAMPLNSQKWDDEAGVSWETLVDEAFSIRTELIIRAKRSQNTFAAQMTAGIIKYLKLKCNIRSVGLVSYMMDVTSGRSKFPTFSQKHISVKDMSADTILRMDEECIYYFD